MDELYTQAQRELHSLQVNDLRDLCEERREIADGRAEQWEVAILGMKPTSVAISPNHISVWDLPIAKASMGQCQRLDLTLRCGGFCSLRNAFQEASEKKSLRIDSFTIYA